MFSADWLNRLQDEIAARIIAAAEPAPDPHKWVSEVCERCGTTKNEWVCSAVECRREQVPWAFDDYGYIARKLKEIEAEGLD